MYKYILQIYLCVVYYVFANTSGQIVHTVPLSTFKLVSCGVSMTEEEFKVLCIKDKLLAPFCCNGNGQAEADKNLLGQKCLLMIF